MGPGRNNARQFRQSYFTALYSFTIECADDVTVADQLHPEWSTMRFMEYGESPLASITPDEVAPTYPLVSSGPTSRTIRFALRRSRIWGLGLQPVGGAKYVSAPANSLADKIVNAGETECFAGFAPILEEVRFANCEPDEMARRINDRLLEMEQSHVINEAKLLACQELLRDPETTDVAILADRLQMGRRTLERMCARYFGFPRLGLGCAALAR